MLEFQLPAQRDWATGLGRTGIEHLRGYLTTAQPIPGLAGQSGGRQPGGSTGTESLSATAATVAATMGVTAEQFAAAAPAEA